jgi:hypothetical protein
MSEQFEFEREETLCTTAEGQLKAALTLLETTYAPQKGMLANLLGARLPSHRKRAAARVRAALNALEERPRPAPRYPYPPEDNASAGGEPGLRPLQPLQPLRPAGEQ